jgi:hypothetical protein
MDLNVSLIKMRLHFIYHCATYKQQNILWILDIGDENFNLM